MANAAQERSNDALKGEAQAEPALSAAGRLDKDINVRVVLTSVAGLIAIIAAVHFSVVWLLGSWSEQSAVNQRSVSPLAATELGRLPPEPRLEGIEPRSADDLYSRQQERLASYGWVDRDERIVHIPISVAMRLVVETYGQYASAGSPSSERTIVRPPTNDR